MRRRRWLATAAVVAPVMAFAVGCGHEPSGSAGLGADVEQAEGRVLDMEARVNGTVSERMAVERLTYVRYQGAIATCMRAAGWRYAPPPFASGSAHWAGPHFDEDALWPVDPQQVDGAGLGLAADARVAWTQTHGPFDPTNPGPLDEPTRDAYSAAVDACQPATATYADLWGQYGVPSLRVEWAQLKTEASTAEAVRQAQERYPACMAQAGWAASSRSELVEMLSRQFHDASGALLDPASAAFRSAESAERAAAKADIGCRDAAHAAAMVVLAASAADLQARRDGDLADAQRQFDRLARDVSGIEGDVKALEQAVAAGPGRLGSGASANREP